MKKRILFWQGGNGFTLIELVIVIGILAILAVFAIAALNPLAQFRKARDAGRKSDLAQIQRALEQYYQDHGKYPANSPTYTLTDINGTTIPWNSAWIPYMNVVPIDVDTGRKYIYVATNNYQQYQIYASLEQGLLDPSVCTANIPACQAKPTDAPSCNCLNVPTNASQYGYCGTVAVPLPCNYGVSSPNTTP